MLCTNDFKHECRVRVSATKTTRGITIRVKGCFSCSPVFYINGLLVYNGLNYRKVSEGTYIFKDFGGFTLVMRLNATCDRPVGNEPKVLFQHGRWRIPMKRSPRVRKV